ncbi:hypothetical protein CJ030_MR5G010496 [Morella rubra]|uniref:Uncharacterized protein n=1 Tax=Morella rubra TaxID=262757 RepID=A0A6A1VLS9_9ROSI|nr:hypothetical protein CJ030_MR5G010496 [Morella rubra]
MPLLLKPISKISKFLASEHLTSERREKCLITEIIIIHLKARDILLGMVTVTVMAEGTTEDMVMEEKEGTVMMVDITEGMDMIPMEEGIKQGRLTAVEDIMAETATVVMAEDIIHMVMVGDTVVTRDIISFGGFVKLMINN